MKFRPATLERVAVLEEAVASLRVGPLDPEDRMRYNREAHKLAGSLGTFGFGAGSLFARDIELMLEGDGEIDASRFSELVVALHRELESSPGTTGS